MTAALPEPTEPAEPTEDPGLALLSGDGAGELMSAVLAAVGGRLLRWRTSQVDHQPGVRTTVSYSARVRWSDGTTGVETLGATDGRLPGGVARLSDGEIEIGMWRFPFDPDLPALPAACDAARMQRLANSVGLEGPVRLRVRTYRPRRRAVIELIAGGGPAFVKVLRPGRARPLHQRHRTAVAKGCPVPASLGWTDDGLLVLAGMPGRTLRAVLGDPSAGSPSPNAGCNTRAAHGRCAGERSFIDRCPVPSCPAPILGEIAHRKEITG